MINKKFLLIVEGKKTEPTIFESIFLRYGFTVNTGPQIPLNHFRKEEYFINDSQINIFQGPRNRIGEMLKKYKDNSTDLQKIFKECGEICAGIFIIYDVDHTSNQDLKAFSDLFSDELEGLLLVSSPCIEVMSDINRTEPLECIHLKEYKSTLNKKFNKPHKSTMQYIINNFESLSIEIIDKNVKELHSSNVMEHPHLIIDLINKNNIRYDDPDNKSVVYRYFTTVVYVAVAYILGLTKEIDNAEIVKDFFKKHKK